MIVAPLLRIAAATTAGKLLKDAAADATQRLLLTLGAGAAGVIGVFCFSRAALTLLERHMDPAEAWAVVGSFYGVMGGLFYFAATRRRRL